MRLKTFLANNKLESTSHTKNKLKRKRLIIRCNYTVIIPGIVDVSKKHTLHCMGNSRVAFSSVKLTKITTDCTATLELCLSNGEIAIMTRLDTVFCVFVGYFVKKINIM